jgi:orotidine-5'-phosphate decarboxylase
MGLAMATAEVYPRSTMTNHGSQEKSLLSTKDIPRKERLIVALDVPTHVEAWKLIDELGDAVSFYKVGLELFLAGNYLSLVGELVERKKKVFVDLKFFDVPETVQSAVRQLRGKGATFATVHGNENMLRAACAEKETLKILAVTVLTSMDEDDLADLGFPPQVSVEELVLSRAKRALDVGCDGVIASGLEGRSLREQYGDSFLIVSPGIRPRQNRLADDQKRVVTERQAFINGADYIVVGRPIRNATDPREAALEIQRTIAELFPK